MKMQRLVIALTVVNLALLAFAIVQIASDDDTTAKLPDAIEAKKIELTDEYGLVRASLRVEDSGEVVFRLTDQEGTIRTKLGAGEDGSGLVLNNDATEPGIHLLADKDGSRILVQNADGSKETIEP